MKNMTKEEKEEKVIIKKCRQICNRNNEEDAKTLIRKEYPGCAISIYMSPPYGQGLKLFMGSMLYKNFNISF